MSINNIMVQMRRGTLEYCVLAVLSRGHAYSSDIIDELKRAEVIVVEGTLYPILTRQSNQGLLSYRWEESTQGPPRKYYTLTEEGRNLLHKLDDVWGGLVEQIDRIRWAK